MSETTYGYTVILEGVDFESARDRVIEVLKTEGFGVLTEIDVKSTLKAKLDVEFRKYAILGACNPVLAHQALSGEPLIGLLLPCNAVVYENDDGDAVISIIKPREMFKVVNNPDVEHIAGEVDAKLQRVIAVLS